ncbi:helix-turn-helix domain-containing protein [Nocardia amikacinitolerans]|uniref:AlbA family DNA-binding domain-containing protein n=1 Tax=Nocardia amikacinitolerans TaxID=756689 RepID=UPI00368F10F9
MTTAGPLWNPRTEADLRAAQADGLLEETHYLDLKRQLDRGKAASKKLAPDLAGFALDGGTILIGIGEGEPGGVPQLWPVELAGLPERVENIATTAVHEPVRVKTTVIPATGQPGKGYLVVHIPQSSRAPHMVDGRYYGRGDKRNRVLPHEEVLRLHQQRLAGQKDIIAETHRAIIELGPRQGRDSILALLAEPVNAPEEILVPLTEADGWEQTVLNLVHKAVRPEHHEFAPSLAGASGFGRRANAVALTTGMYNGRWQGNEDAAEVAFHENGSLLLASERAATTMRFPRATPEREGTEVVFEPLVLGHTDLLVRLATVVAEEYGYTGMWRFGLVITGLRGCRSYALCQHRYGPDGAPYTARTYERATEAAFLDLANPRAIVKTLVAPLLRSLGSHRAWERSLTE